MMTQIHAKYCPLLDLPAELFSSIIKFLSEDKYSLRSCSLTSRAFLSTAQALLFRRVVLNVRSRYNGPRAGTKLQCLLELPHLLKYTREFQINGVDSDSETWLAVNSDTELLSALKAFINLKKGHITDACACSLQFISFTRITWPMSPNLLNQALQRLLGLESVTHIEFNSNHLPLNTFDHFPSRVKTLKLAFNTFQNSEAVVHVAKPDGYHNIPTFRLESLTIRKGYTPYKFEWTIFNNPGRRCDGTSIRALRLSGLRVQDFGMFALFAPHVERLDLEMTSCSALIPLDLGQFSRLRYLHIQIFPLMAVDKEIRWLARSLRYLKTGNQFRSITFSDFPDIIHDISAWTELDEVLVGPQFESESFSGMIIGVRKYSSMTHFFSVLPRAIDKKRLQVVHDFKEDCY